MEAHESTIRSVGVIVNPQKVGAFPLIKQVIAWLEGKGIRVLLDSGVVNAMNSPAEAALPREMPGNVDLMVAFGGDGTMLSVAQLVNGATTPLMGVKVGGLGFMTTVTEEEVFSTLEEVLTGRHRVEQRMMLTCTVIHPDGSVDKEYMSLNDVVIQRDSLERMLTIETYVDDDFLASYACDGLIISTPTGSTAHSLSAGGPILYPEVEAIVVTPICPHMLTNRPLVLSANQVLRAAVVSKFLSTGLMIDGQIAIRLHPGDKVIVRKSPFSIRLVAPSTKSYFEVLRTKLNWGRR